MKRGSTLFLKVVVLLIALVAAIALIWFPQTEGRAKDLDLVSIYLDPFIIYIYIASLPFFLALYQAYKLLKYIERDKIFSQSAIGAVRNVKYCAFAVIGFLLTAILYIRFVVKGDDPAGPTMLGFVAVFISIVIATATSIFQKLLQNAVDMKSENDLTV